jgi:hypothetical protein
VTDPKYNWMTDPPAPQRNKLEAPDRAMVALDTALRVLLRDTGTEQREMSFLLLRAAVAVALHGVDAIPVRLKGTALSWQRRTQAQVRKRTEDHQTSHAFLWSSAPKVRDPSSGDGAYDEVGKAEKISPHTVEKRKARHRKRFR